MPENMRVPVVKAPAREREDDVPGSVIEVDLDDDVVHRTPHFESPPWWSFKQIVDKSNEEDEVAFSKRHNKNSDLGFLLGTLHESSSQPDSLVTG